MRNRVSISLDFHVHAQLLSHDWLFRTLWMVACQCPLPPEFSRQEYWSGLPFPPPGDLPDPGFKPASPALAGGFFTTAPPGKLCLDFHQLLLLRSKSGILLFSHM